MDRAITAPKCGSVGIYILVVSTVQIAKIVGSISIKHQSDTLASDRCLIDIDATVFAMRVRTCTSVTAYLKQILKVSEQITINLLIGIRHTFLSTRSGYRYCLKQENS